MTQREALPPGAAAVQQYLEMLRAGGVTHLPRARVASVPHPPPAAEPAAAGPPEPAADSSSATVEPADALRVLEQEVCRCTRCPELVASRSQTVFGTGPARPRLCFFGEAPGADEDRQGEPFVGAAGQLLNRIIVAMSLRREEVYILNVLKCRPPGNRNPAHDEIENCRPFWQRQLEILQPQFICCLGGFAAKTLLQTDESVGRLRGRFHQYEQARVRVTYHPSYLLRSPGEKAKAWDDIQALMQAMGLQRPE